MHGAAARFARLVEVVAASVGRGVLLLRVLTKAEADSLREGRQVSWDGALRAQLRLAASSAEDDDRLEERSGDAAGDSDEFVGSVEDLDQ